MRLSLWSAVIILSLTFSLSAQELSTIVFPSEDELYEAFILGELDYDQYLILIDLAGQERYLDSSLFDLIPNLSFFDRFRVDSTGALASDQAEIVALRPKSKRDGKLRFKHQYYTFLEENSSSRYRSQLDIKITQRISLFAESRREYSGRERLIGRGIVYRSRTGLLRELQAGNFSKRVGLGTVFGNRGKLFDFSDQINDESLLFPDRSGYNGLLVSSAANQHSMTLLSSHNRDSLHSITSLGMAYTIEKLPLSPGLILGMNRLRSHRTDSTLSDYKIALGTNYDYSNGYLRTESALQRVDSKSDFALVVECSHNYAPSRLNYSFWYYGKNFLDLTSGSKAAAISATKYLEEIDFSFSSRRSDQIGGLLKTSSSLSQNLKLINSLLLAARNSDTTDAQFMPALEKSGDKLILRIDYLIRSKRRISSGNSNADLWQQARFEVRFLSGNYRIRSYIGYTDNNSKQRYWSLFNNLSYNSSRIGQLELWSNLGRISSGNLAIDYWYNYLKISQAISSELSLAMKLTHRYNRSESDKHQTTVMLEIESNLF